MEDLEPRRGARNHRPGPEANDRRGPSVRRLRRAIDRRRIGVLSRAFKLIYAPIRAQEPYASSIDSFFSFLKGGVYHNVSKMYLPFYLNEFSCRFNDRNNEIIFVALTKTSSPWPARIE